MNITNLKKLVEKVAKLNNNLKYKYYYGDRGNKQILKKYITGEKIKTPNYTLIIHIHQKEVTFLYENRFTKWDFHEKELPSEVLDQWINYTTIMMESPVELSTIEEVENIMYGLEQLEIKVEDEDSEE